jgi:hypothetical protein
MKMWVAMFISSFPPIRVSRAKKKGNKNARPELAGQAQLQSFSHFASALPIRDVFAVNYEAFEDSGLLNCTTLRNRI